MCLCINYNASTPKPDKDGWIECYKVLIEDSTRTWVESPCYEMEIPKEHNELKSNRCSVATSPYEQTARSIDEGIHVFRQGVIPFYYSTRKVLVVRCWGHSEDLVAFNEKEAVFTKVYIDEKAFQELHAYYKTGYEIQE